MESSARPTTAELKVVSSLTEGTGDDKAEINARADWARRATDEAYNPIPAHAESDTAVSRARDGVTEVNGVRLYQTAGGSFPSVTSILSATKPESDKAGLAKWRRQERAAEADR